ncbi:iron ABC transporter substrate-binding protein [Natronoarchaeum rubrum]|uniref:iron ABC transporter substrate-binding protein n=1 Tax=Natronoarchaeum rubrum TaxID=755311 RepID=UPI0021127E39|nr:iron ABC transporter substrate-binding protein [Natronoarchaeum rubrum]HMB51393.1 iron ABC transporter substrate-binding protein [Natronoarchaeum rubrum]
MNRNDDTNGWRDRRSFLAGTAALGAAGLAGCTGLFGGGDEEDDQYNYELEQIGSGREGRELSGVPMSEMPDLEGELTIYSGRNEFLVGPLIEAINDFYDDFEATPRYQGSTDLVNKIRNEGSGSPADVFYSVNSGSLGALADAGRTRSLASDVAEMVPPEFRTDQWIGTSGRARSVPYNTDAYSASDMPTSIDAYTDFDGQLGWAPGYGSCQAFVTAMRLLEGESATREWLEGIQSNGIQRYPNELAVCEAIADGEIDAGFTNHYYIQRVLDGSSNASIATAFTQGDAGSVFNVAGAAVVDSTDSPDLAQNFVRHLLSAQAQDYFARQTFEYPMSPEVDPIGNLPPIDELNPPSGLDLSELSNLQPTVDLMRDVGINL